MPTNVSPEYKKAEAEYRRARDPDERLRCLKEMLSTIPKHKGTEHLQADIKSRIKELTEELAGPRKGGARTGPLHAVRPEGAAQVALIGPPNSGKSSLHRVLTGSQAEVGPYPGTTQAPLPGMLFHEDVPFQLVDLPAVSVDFMVPWLPNALQPASAALLVVDLGVPGCVENVAVLCEKLDAKRISLTDDWNGRLGRGWLGDDAQPGEAGTAGAPGAPEAASDKGGGNLGGAAPDAAAAAASTENGGAPQDEPDLDDPFRTILPTLLVANKRDRGFDPEEVGVLEELVGFSWPAVAVSAETGAGLAQLGRLLHHGLGVVRVYTKVPGKPPDMERPYTVFEGDRVIDVARLIHREMAASLRFARLWGSGKFDGQQVGRDHPVRDGDVLELHA